MNTNDIRQAIQDAYRQAVEDGMVKIFIPCRDEPGISGEWCWAKQVAHSFARLANCCVFVDGVNFGDVVAFCERNDDSGGPHAILKHFVRVVSRGSTQFIVGYATDAERSCDPGPLSDELQKRFVAIQQFCEAMPVDVQPLAVEGVGSGFACIAFPVSVSEAQVGGLLARCPYLIEEE